MESDGLTSESFSLSPITIRLLSLTHSIRIFTCVWRHRTPARCSYPDSTTDSNTDCTSDALPDKILRGSDTFPDALQAADTLPDIPCGSNTLPDAGGYALCSNGECAAVHKQNAIALLNIPSVYPWRLLMWVSTHLYADAMGIHMLLQSRTMHEAIRTLCLLPCRVPAQHSCSMHHALYNVQRATCIMHRTTGYRSRFPC
jgi:hypothetical protein